MFGFLLLLKENVVWRLWSGKVFRTFNELKKASTVSEEVLWKSWKRWAPICCQLGCIKNVFPWKCLFKQRFRHHSVRLQKEGIWAVQHCRQLFFLNLPIVLELLIFLEHVWWALGEAEMPDWYPSLPVHTKSHEASLSTRTTPCWPGLGCYFQAAGDTPPSVQHFSCPFTRTPSVKPVSTVPVSILNVPWGPEWQGNLAHLVSAGPKLKFSTVPIKGYSSIELD